MLITSVSIYLEASMYLPDVSTSGRWLPQDALIGGPRHKNIFYPALTL